MRSSKNTLRYLMLSMLCGSCMVVCLAPYVLTTFMRDFATPPETIAVFQILLQGTILCVLPGAMILRKSNPKYSVIYGLLIARLPLLLLPLLPIFQPDWMIAGAMFVCIFLGMTSSFASSSLDVWFRQIIPARILGSFLGRRMALCFGIMAILMPTIGYWLDHPGTFGLTRSSIYAVLFLFAVVLGFGDLFFLHISNTSKVNEPATSEGVRAELIQVIRTPGFFRVAFITVLPVVSLLLISPYGLLILYDFQLDRFQVGVLTAISTFAIGVGTVIGGKRADRTPELNALSNLPIALRISVLLGLVLLLLLFAGAHILTPFILFILLSPLFAYMTFLQGVSVSLGLRLLYDNVRGGSTISFGFIRFLQGGLVVIVLTVSAGLGSFFIAATLKIQTFWPNFHYAYALYLLAILCGFISAYAIRKLVHDYPILKKLRKDINKIESLNNSAA